ncbi:MAG: hypothetical protein Q7R22_000190, partial [Verrucomicrobiota bacterium JB025]|nr:hypothetical protein [Verrucomicrobiota bacterium JB025]
MKTSHKAPLSPLDKAGLPTGAHPGGFHRSGARGTGRKRILGSTDETNCYHVMSRSAGGEMLFGEVDKEAFGRIMRRLERFAGVEVLTHC